MCGEEGSVYGWVGGDWDALVALAAPFFYTSPALLDVAYAHRYHQVQSGSNSDVAMLGPGRD